MITDEKTLNRLHADVNEGLFTLENKSDAVFRILNIIRDTPQYLQLMPFLPAYAQEAPKSLWWQSMDANRLLDELLHVLEMYAPENHVLVPLQNRAYRFGYIDREIEENILYRIDCHMVVPEEYTRNEYQRTKFLFDEIAGLFRKEGYTVSQTEKGCVMKNGKTELVSGIYRITGYCESGHMLPLVHLLLIDGKRFRLGYVNVLDSVLGHTKEEEYKAYVQQYESSIYYLVFDLFSRKPFGAVSDNLMEIAKGINMPTRERPEGCTTHSPAFRFVSDACRKLVDKGYLEEHTVNRFGEDTVCLRATEAGRAKKIFYGTKL